METLNKLLANKVVEFGLLEGFLIIFNSNSESMLISYLLFADDTLFFCQPEESDLGFFFKVYFAVI